MVGDFVMIAVAGARWTPGRHDTGGPWPRCSGFGSLCQSRCGVNSYALSRQPYFRPCRCGDLGFVSRQKPAAHRIPDVPATPDVEASCITSCRGSRVSIFSPYPRQFSKYFIGNFVDCRGGSVKWFLLSQISLPRWQYHLRVARATFTRASRHSSLAAGVIIPAPVGEGRGVSVVMLNSFGFNPLGAPPFGPHRSSGLLCPSSLHSLQLWRKKEPSLSNASGLRTSRTMWIAVLPNFGWSLKTCTFDLKDQHRGSYGMSAPLRVVARDQFGRFPWT